MIMKAERERERMMRREKGGRVLSLPNTRRKFKKEKRIS